MAHNAKKNCHNYYFVYLRQLYLATAVNGVKVVAFWKYIKLHFNGELQNYSMLYPKTF